MDKMTFQKMDDGIGCIHDCVVYGYFTISNDKILWNPTRFRPSGHDICLELLRQIVDKMEKLQAEADESCGM